MKKLSFFVFCLVVFSFAPVAHAFELNALGAFDYSAQEVGPSVPGVVYGANPTFGYGGEIGFDFAPKIGVQVGALFLQRGQSVTVSPLPTAAYSYPTWNFPVTLQIKPSSLFSFGLGGYYALMQSATGTASIAGVTGPYYVTGVNSNEWGLTGEAKFHFAIAPSVNFIFGAQYFFGLTNNLMASGSTSFSRDFVAISGLGISI